MHQSVFVKIIYKIKSESQGRKARLKARFRPAQKGPMPPP